MPDRLFLGSEIIIISVEDARTLVNAFLKSRSDLERLQQLGALGVLDSLGNAIMRHDYERWEGKARKVEDA